MFPAVDPIPLPAPVWLFKVLHNLTLGLHFTAVELLIGGVLVAAWLNFRGGARRGGAKSALRLNVAGSLARRLPVVMTYVINLGVPPLLFAQVLYGRALYTSSVLIGVYWIGVVFLLMACYWLLYQFSNRAQAGKSAWLLGLGVWLLAGLIARIYSTNMTLMLRPEVWNSMYSASAIGIHLPPADPTLLPRWAFMIAGGFALTGLWMIWLAGRSHLASEVRTELSAQGGRLALIMGAVQVWLALLAFRAQPEAVRAGLTATEFYRWAGTVWLATAGLLIVVSAWCSVAKPTSALVGWVAAAAGVVAMLAMVCYRDGIRDLTLAGKGFDVWQRTVVTNWSVVGLFLVVFVAGLGGLGWLISVVRSAKPISERVVL
jgi:hypothetical protein